MNYEIDDVEADDIHESKVLIDVESIENIKVEQDEIAPSFLLLGDGLID